MTPWGVVGGGDHIYISLSLSLCLFKYIYIYGPPASRFLPSKAILFGENLECHPMPDRIYCHIYIYRYIHYFGIIQVYFGAHSSKNPNMFPFLGIQASVYVHIYIYICKCFKFISIYLSIYIYIYMGPLLHDSSPHKQSFSGKTQNATPCPTVNIVIYIYIFRFIFSQFWCNLGILWGRRSTVPKFRLCFLFWGIQASVYLPIYIYLYIYRF